MLATITIPGGQTTAYSYDDAACLTEIVDGMSRAWWTPWRPSCRYWCAIAYDAGSTTRPIWRENELLRTRTPACSAQSGVTISRLIAVA